VLYVDHYGNLITGLQAEHADGTATLRLGETRINAARTFCMLPPGTAFWYRNAFDLVEIAVNQGQAHQRFGVGSGAKVAWDTL
jgi:S-adenosylmethionine hydrolase